MASWKDGQGFYTWGTYGREGGVKYNVYAVGGPGGGNSDYFNISNDDMNALRARNYGTGVHFWWDGDILSVTINLILITSGKDWRYISGQSFYGSSSTNYEFYADIQYQTVNGNWVKLGDNYITTHYGGQPLYPKSGWDSVGSGYLWKTFTLGKIDPNTVKQFSIGIHGDNVSVENWVYYPIEKIKPKEKQKFTITTRYKIENTNTELRPPDIDEVTEGETFTKYPRDIDDYESLSSPQRFAVYVNREVTFWYKRKVTEGKLTFYYLDSKTGATLKNSEVVTGSIGQRIVKQAPAIDGHTPIMKEIAIIIQSPNGEYVFYYDTVAKIRPWAIRSSGVWRSLATQNTWMKVRRNANQNYWDTRPNAEILPSEVGRDNFSASRIRKSGAWKAQGRIGQ